MEQGANDVAVGEDFIEKVRSLVPIGDDQEVVTQLFFDDPRCLKKAIEAHLKLTAKGKFECLGIDREDALMISSFIWVDKLIDEVNYNIRTNWDNLRGMNDSTDNNLDEDASILMLPFEYLNALVNAFARYPRFTSSKIVYTARALEEGEEIKQGDTFVWKEFIFASTSQPSVTTRKVSTKSLIFEVHGDFLAYDVSVIGDPKRLVIKDSKIDFKDSTVVIFPGTSCTVKDVRTDEYNENILRVYVECHSNSRIHAPAAEPSQDYHQMKVSCGVFDSFNSLSVDFYVPLKDAISYAFRKNIPVQSQVFKKLRERGFKEDEEALLKTLGMSKDNFLALYLLSVEIEFQLSGRSEEDTTIRFIEYINHTLTKNSMNIYPFRELILHILCSIRRIPRYLENEDGHIYMLMDKAEIEDTNVLSGITLAYDRKRLMDKIEKLAKAGEDDGYSTSTLVVCEIVKGYEHLQAHSAVPFINVYSRVSSKGIQDESKKTNKQAHYFMFMILFNKKNRHHH